MRALFKTWLDTPKHIDWAFGALMKDFAIYAPDEFLIGQNEGHSNISNENLPARFWIRPHFRTPVLLIDAPRAIVRELKEHGVYFGSQPNPRSGIDQRLAMIMHCTESEPKR